uniref:Signal induced proliferation associated 1 like 2 n=1 Tax=Oncorhynchus mykiss TaxID=8022 RepID=A0A8K9XE92_ONCMY
MSGDHSATDDETCLQGGGGAGEEQQRAMQPQSEELLTRKLKALNGSMGPPAQGTQQGNKPDGGGGGGKTNGTGETGGTGTTAMPKMGIRAWATDWPPAPRRDICDGGCQNSPKYESIVTAFHNDQQPLEQSGADPRYSLSDLLGRSPLKGAGLHPIRQRSNSDVTISDIDSEDIIMDGTAVNPNTGAALHREYGSTSSIDRQGLSGDGFHTLLRGYRIDTLDHTLHTLTHPHNSMPRPLLGLPELLQRYDTSLSPSLQTATQISRGEIVRMAGYDYVDPSIFYSREREKNFMGRLKSDSSETSMFRKLRTIKSEGLLSLDQDDRRPLSFQKCFAHYDVQSVLFNISEAVASRATLSQRKNTTTGASAASQYQPGARGGSGSPLGSREDLNPKENLDQDEGDGKNNRLVLGCPHFRNEIGGEGERRISLSRANSASYSGGGESCSFESSLSSHCTNAGVSVLEVPRENQPIHREKVKRYIIEHIDLGAFYYHKFFYGKEHQNYFGVDENLGPVAVSIRREKLDEGKEKEWMQYNYRVTFRTSQLTTLRGAILEDAVPSTARHGTARGLPLKEVLEYVMPELNIHCLRLALNSPKVPEQLLKLDEQGLSFQHKVGVLYCKAGQSTEEEMYNNQSAGPALDEFLDLLGQRVKLKGFTKYRAQLDNRTDSTGTYSLYTTYKDYELMFHVSTLLPYTPNNRQQLLRKRHIGNDIVTIVFQEPGTLPFTPKNIRSHFQHVFVIVKVHNPCTENVCYSVAVSRSKDVPLFGPPIPKAVTFPKSAVFRDFLLAKVINGENAAHKSEKFRAMATRTRQEYLRDLAENFVSTATMDSAVKFSFITLGAKKKEKAKPREDAHLFSVGAITWSVTARDFGQSADVDCLLGVSNEFIILIEEQSKNVVFNCSCRDVIGWTSGIISIKIFYERGECVLLSAQDGCEEDIREMVQRLEIVTRGCETSEMTLRRNALCQLGFHVNFEGIVADVEAFGFAWKAGLRQGSRLVEICKVAVATLTHEQMIDLLRTSIAVKVVIIQPHDDGAPRRGCSELYRIPMVEYKLDSEGTPCEYKTPFRRNTTWHRVPTSAGQPSNPNTRCSPTQRHPDRAGRDRMGQQVLQQGQTAIPRSTSFDRKLPDGSSHSSCNTLSSNASSNNSDDKHFGSGDLMDPEILGLTYIKGASTDSGIDTNPCMGPGGRLLMQGGCGGEVGHTKDGCEGEDHGKLYLPQGYASAIMSGHVTEGSIGDLSEISSHSHSSHSSGSPLARGARYCVSADSSRVYTFPQTSSGAGPGQGAGLEASGQTRPVPGSKRLMKTEDSPTNEEPKLLDLSPRRSLYRTLSDESVCSSNRKGSSYASSHSSMLDQVLPNDILFSTTPPYHATLPPRMPGQGGSNLRNEFWFSDGSLADRSKFNDPGLMPLPDSASGLDWSHLVDAARTFEDQRVASFCTMTDMQRAEALQISQELTRRVAAAEGAALEAGNNSPSTLTGKVNQLEVILRQLQYDLRKEKEDKVLLQVEVQHLRQDNMRLQEESQTSAAQLRKFTEWFFHTIDKKP